MEEDLVIDDEDSWDLLVRDIRLKATFLFIDLSRVISFCEIDEHKKMLTGLANKFFIFMDELANAVSSRSVPLMQVCYRDTALVLREVVAALVPS
ncbi:hypothetical protein GUJ93_ZPchr0014g46521 [Zizania palustris]|uniref:Uncharacterized protein n=1 Tax=Zizania palustris TaxID=103762 RepID=A0A8J5TBV1_ZIZPA|nr:hypothetical protein GUJ93_ZPchr0014g46521 [Zizania palustris]